ncbi:MAG: glycine--tRNA ligase subunit beta [Candidatus Firestonebacteria bacterium]|nr:glycine--tRNA ligase subunit beta [Candidatus Firestonebacteria bacterium]
MSKDLIIEIGAEEIPASYISSAMKQLSDNLVKLFAENKINIEGGMAGYSTPRRFALIVNGVSELQKDIALELMGPPKKAAYDVEGKPTQAGVGFAKTQGMDIKDLIIKSTPKGDYLCAQKLIKGKPVKEVLPELMKKIVLSLNWPKSMRWHDEVRFPRPIRSLLCLFGGEIIGFTVSDVTSSNKTYGHRVLSPEGAEVSDSSVYLSILREKSVIADFEERKNELIKQVKELALKAGGVANISPVILEENVNTVEYPTAMLGKFDEKYLALPKELLLQVIEKTQKYFSVWDEKKEKILPYFIAIKNGKDSAIPVIIEGNARVLKARFEDAEFFFKEDKKTTLKSKLPKLKAVSFQDKLGTMFDKTERLIRLANEAKQMLKLSEYDDIKNACELCKIDLNTGMVREFTELQGIIGREYALADGVKKEVAMAISEHYLPRFLGDELPKTETGMALAILDKIDTIVGCFSIGLIPTGSQDPYGLRRNALGVISIILNNKIEAHLGELIDASIDTYSDKVKTDKQKVLRDILEFIKGRMENLLLDKGIRYDVVNAVLASEFANITLTFKKAEELNLLSKEPDFNKTIITFSRVINIISKNSNGTSFLAGADEKLLRETEEKNLYGAIEARKPNFLKMIENADYTSAFKVLKELMPFIDDFFEKTMVMDKDKTVKDNRIALLTHLNFMFKKIADFSKIVQ